MIILTIILISATLKMFQHFTAVNGILVIQVARNSLTKRKDFVLMPTGYIVFFLNVYYYLIPNKGVCLIISYRAVTYRFLNMFRILYPIFPLIQMFQTDTKFVSLLF